jgi:hypothetical protein
MPAGSRQAAALARALGCCLRRLLRRGSLSEELAASEDWPEEDCQ